MLRIMWVRHWAGTLGYSRRLISAWAGLSCTRLAEVPPLPCKEEGVPRRPTGLQAQRWRSGIQTKEKPKSRTPQMAGRRVPRTRISAPVQRHRGRAGESSYFSPLSSSCDVFLTLIRDPSPREPTIMINGVKYSQRPPGAKLGAMHKTSLASSSRQISRAPRPGAHEPAPTVGQPDPAASPPLPPGVSAQGARHVACAQMHPLWTEPPPDPGKP